MIIVMEAIPTSRPSILVVDDTAANLTAIESTLAGVDARLLLVGSGEQALDILLNEKTTPALALLDVQMPIMDGYELATLLRSRNKTRSMPIIFLSAVFRDIGHIAKGYDTGAVDFLTKPFDTHLLLSKVRVFLELYRYRQQAVLSAVHTEQASTLELIMASLPTPLLYVDARGYIEMTNVAARKLLGAGVKDRLWRTLFEEEEEEEEDRFARAVARLAANRMSSLILKNADVFRRMLIDAQVAALVVDSKGQVELANSEAYRLLGYEPNSLKGVNVHVLTPRNVRDVHVKYVVDYASNPVPRLMGRGRVLSALTKDGREIPVEIGLFPVQWEGEPCTIAILLDADARRQWQIIKLTAFGRFFEEEEEEEEVVQVERMLKLHDGRHLPVALSVAPLRRANGKLDGAVFSLMDLSGIREREAERLEIVERMQRMQRMESLGQLAAGIAHDFNNLLCVMQCHAELIGIKLPLSSPAEADVRTILQAIERATGIVEKLMALGRKPLAAHRPFRMGMLLEEVAVLLKASMKGVEIVFDKKGAGEAVDEEVIGDSGLFEQALVNLCVNARHALKGRRDGRIVLRLKKKLEDNAGKRWLELEVEDNGCGIPREVMPRIFEPFFTTRDVGEGSGLGLSTVYSTIRQMGGAIACESTVGVGTRFMMRIPCGAEGR